MKFLFTVRCAYHGAEDVFCQRRLSDVMQTAECALNRARWNYKLYSGNNVKNENKNVNNENNKNSGTLQKGAAFENGRFYEIEEESRPGQRYPVEEDELGTFIMSSKDLCMIEHVGELCEAGINSFKIEGRMKSAYYTAVASNAYRMAIDSWSSGVDLETGRLLEELESVSHREYGTGFFYDDCDRAPQLISDVSRGYIREKLIWRLQNRMMQKQVLQVLFSEINLKRVMRSKLFHLEGCRGNLLPRSFMMTGESRFRQYRTRI